MFDDIKKILINELTTETDTLISDMARVIIKDMDNPPLGVVFYGSVLREINYEGILDFYIITEKPDDIKGSKIGRFFNTILPPNVYYIEKSFSGTTLRAKVAVLSLPQFLKRSSLKSEDTTIWARFCQPVRLVWVRDTSSADSILNVIEKCVITASCWAALLGPKSGRAEQYWHNLFSKTYAVELRVEKKGRSHNLLKNKEERYENLLFLALESQSIKTDIIDGTISPRITENNKKKAYNNWNRIKKIGRPLNIIRLLKASFTFKDGVAYLLWKIRRHTGNNINISSFEKKHPIISLPLLLWRLRKTKFS